VSILPIKAERIIHTIHAVRDMDGSRMQYQDVLGGTVFAEGYEATADRDMALLYVRDHMIEPMAPRNPDVVDKGFAKWLARFGEGWHSFEIKVADAPAAAEALEAEGSKLIKSAYPVFFFVRAESTGGVLLEVCERPMPNDPYDRRGWDPFGVGVDATGIVKLDHIACVVPDVAAARAFFTQMFDGEVLEERADRVLLRIGDTQVAFSCPDGEAFAEFRARPHGGIYALVWEVEDEAQARAEFERRGLRTLTNGCAGGGFAIDPADFRGARHEFLAR
jgi:catechol 2,3-dioxygenase-like lactoylglutathione lyase family enzyme/extradiol dioxygenase family protein